MLNLFFRKFFNSPRPGEASPASTNLIEPEPTLALLLNQAKVAVDAGNVALAKQFLAKVDLAAAFLPEQALTLANILVGCGHFDEAAAVLTCCSENDTSNPDLLNGLGNIKRMQGAFLVARELYQQALTTNPACIPARINLASLLSSEAQWDAAIDLLQNGLSLHPTSIDLERELAGLLIQQQRWDEASNHYRRVLEATPRDPVLRYLYGVSQYNQGLHTEAETQLQKALAEKPDFPEALHVQSLIYLDRGELEDAEDSLHLALHHAPDFGEAELALARLKKRQGNLQEAIKHYRHAIFLSGEAAKSLAELGELLYEAGEFIEAIQTVNRALQLDPNAAKAHNTLGLLMLAQGQPEAAENAFKQATLLDATFKDAQINVCLAKQNAGNLVGAIQCCETLLDSFPEHPQLLWQLVHNHLLDGNFAQAWDDYELRAHHEDFLKREFSFPVWHNESLTGKSLLIYAEQGLGDEIMFASCLPDILPLARQCVIECDPRLTKLFSRSFPVAQVTGWKQAERKDDLFSNEHIDFQTAIGSLPRFFRRSWADFPEHSGYLKADPERIAVWRERLTTLGGGLKVGISWRGGMPKSRRDIRSISLTQWEPILKQAGCHFISLQYTPCLDELALTREALGVDIHHWQEAIDDYDETAALVSALDLVITVCTSIAHLTGALGRPAWVMVPAIPEWRYLAQGEKMPWYPSVTLIRQKQVGIWRPVIAQVTARLTNLSQSDA